MEEVDTFLYATASDGEDMVVGNDSKTQFVAFQEGFLADIFSPDEPCNCSDYTTDGNQSVENTTLSMYRVPQYYSLPYKLIGCAVMSVSDWSS